MAGDISQTRKSCSNSTSSSVPNNRTCTPRLSTQSWRRQHNRLPAIGITEGPEPATSSNSQRRGALMHLGLMERVGRQTPGMLPSAKAARPTLFPDGKASPIRREEANMQFPHTLKRVDGYDRNDLMDQFCIWLLSWLVDIGAVQRMSQMPMPEGLHKMHSNSCIIAADVVLELYNPNLSQLCCICCANPCTHLVTVLIQSQRTIFLDKSGH